MDETHAPQSHDPREESLTELQEAGAALRRLAEHEGELAKVLERFRLKDVPGVREILDRLGLLGRCRLVCHWLCIWHCLRLCRVLCKKLPDKELTLPELREFARGIARLTAHDEMLRRLLDAADREDAQAFGAILDEFKLGRFCYLVCQWVCFVRCRLFCELLCTPPGSISVLDPVPELQETGEALARLAEDERTFGRLLEAFQQQDAPLVRGILDSLGLLSHCVVICHWFCFWHCFRICRILCKRLPEKELALPELRELATGLARLTASRDALTRLLEAVEREDAHAFDHVLDQFELGRFCFLVCRWVCHVHCHRFCRILCPPPTPLPVWRKIGVYNYLTAIDSAAAGDGLTLADDRAFFAGLRLNGTLYKTLFGSPMEYRFEVKPVSAAAWNPVLPFQIGHTLIGSWTRWSGIDVEFKDYTVNGAAGPTEVTVLPAADGWIQVPQESDFWNPAGPGFFTPNGNMIVLLSDKIAPWPGIDLSGITAGQSTAPAGLGVDQHFSIRMRVRKVGVPASEMTAGLCENVAIYNRRYNNVTHGGSWAPTLVSNQLGVAMVNIQELGAGCAEITDALTVTYTAAHPNLGGVGLSMTGPGGPYGFTLVDDGSATPPNRFGYATPGFPVSDLTPCAYLVTLSVDLLLTTGDTQPLPLQDQIAFCKQ